MGSQAAIIVGVDVGLANTAIVVLEDGRITDARTITTKSVGRRPTFPKVMERGQAIAEKTSAFLTERCPGAIVAIESYEDIGGGTHQKSQKTGALIPNRWTTPVVCALIGDRLERDGFTVEWQRPSLVMSAYRRYKGLWASKRRGLVPGDSLLTNDHLRSAACHVLWYLDRHPEVRP